jgi:hypothetical protein
MEGLSALHALDVLQKKYLMDPVRDVTPLCPCELLTSNGGRHRCDAPIGVSGGLGNMDYTFISGGQQRSIPWNSIIAYVNLENRSRRIDCLPDNKKEAIRILEEALATAIGTNQSVAVALSDLAAILGRDSESVGRALDDYSSVNLVHRRYVIRRQAEGATLSPLEYRFSISLNPNY